MVDSVHHLVDSCFDEFRPSIPRSLTHHYTTLGLIGYEWMAKGFKEKRWIRNDLFFFSDNNDDDDVMTSHYLGKFEFPSEVLEFSELMYLFRNSMYVMYRSDFNAEIHYDTNAQTIQINLAGSNSNIYLPSYSEKETNLIIKPWIETAIKLISRPTKKMKLYLTSRRTSIKYEEIILHAQPFMPVSLVYIVEEIADTLWIVSLTPPEESSLAMFVHPLTPNIVNFNGQIWLFASIVDEFYFQMPQMFHKLYMQLLCLYSKSSNAA